MQHKVPKVSVGRMYVVPAGMLLAGLLVLMLSYAVPVEAQETTAEQTVAQGEETTSIIEEETTVAETEDTVAENNETTTEAAEKKNDNTKTQNKPSNDSRREDARQAQEKPNAKENDPRVAAAQAGPLTDETAQIIDFDDDDVIVDRIVIFNVDCAVDDGATITVRDADGTQATLTDGGNVDIEQNQGRIVVVGNGEDQDLRGVAIRGRDFGLSNATETGTVVRSTGITCSRYDGGEGPGSRDDDNGLLDLDCDELLQRSRSISGNGGQYGDGFADASVQARVVTCLEREVINNTAADEDLPDTGGLPVLGLAVLGLASAVAGASVIRGARRGE